MADFYDLVIIGAGNLGLWTAYPPAKNGFGSVAVCERNWAGSGTTSRSAGIARQQGGSLTAIKLGQWSRESYVGLDGQQSAFTQSVANVGPKE